jgi:hypothetical protein
LKTVLYLGERLMVTTTIDTGFSTKHGRLALQSANKNSKLDERYVAKGLGGVAHGISGDDQE